MQASNKIDVMVTRTPEIVATEAITITLQAIKALKAAGWAIDARQLEMDLERAGAFLPEILIVRDCAETMLASLG